jgi:hypothetical protein
MSAPTIWWLVEAQCKFINGIISTMAAEKNKNELSQVYKAKLLPPITNALRFPYKCGMAELAWTIKDVLRVPVNMEY